jgi:alkaline phosphatase
MRRAWLVPLLLLLTGCATGRALPAAGGVAEPVRNIIVYVADGAGVEYWTAARLAGHRLAIVEMPVVGLVDTRSASSDLTDSAAGATALATGMRTYNRAISVGMDCRPVLLADSAALRRGENRCRPLESAFDVARARGLERGIVTTAEVTDATPAAFAASVAWRDWHEEIAEQLAAADLAVLLGGGRRYFDGGSRKDGRDLLATLCGRARCVADAEGLAAVADDRPLVGLFTEDDMPAVSQRSPSLPEMVEAALHRLDRAPAGFIALFESEGTDVAGHANQPLEAIVAEVVDFDRSVALGLAYARRTPGTLVIVTSDHETGGLAIVREGNRNVARYATTGHTAAMVPLFAYGPGAERFAGILDNDEVGRILKEIVSGR